MAGMYEGHTERRHQEMRDAGMLSENKSAVANMPQDVKYHAWPSYHVGLDMGIDDTIRGIDRQVDADMSGAKRHMDPTKY